jgi:hypothetical protein
MRFVAKGIVRSEAVQMAKAIAGRMRGFRAKQGSGRAGRDASRRTKAGASRRAPGFG